MNLLRSTWWILTLAACDCGTVPLLPPDAGDATVAADAAPLAIADAATARPDARAEPDAGLIDGGALDAGLTDAAAPLDVHVRAISPTFGPRTGGTTVTILGAGFVPGQTSASIDGAPLTDVVVLEPGVLRGVTSAFAQDDTAMVEVTVGARSHRLFNAFLVEGWTYANVGLPRGFVADLIAVDPASPQVLYVIDDGRLIKSIDGGLTWFPVDWGVETANASSLLIDDTRPARLAMDTKREVWLSGDAGASWTRSAASRLEDYYRPLVAESSRPDIQLMVRSQSSGPFRGYLDIERTPDFWRTRKSCGSGGLSLTTFPSVEAVHMALDGDTVLASLNGVLHRSLPPGCERWTRADGGLVGAPSLIARARGSTVLFALTADGLYSAPDPAAAWSRVGDVPTGTTTRMMVAHTTPPRIYAGAAGAGRAAATWQVITPGGAWAPLDLPTPGPLGIDPSAPDTLYVAGAGGAFRSDDGGASWRLLTAQPKDGGADRLAVSPRIHTQVLAAAGVHLHRSSDGGASWQSSPAALGGRPVIDVIYAPRTASTAYASSSTVVLRTRDGGASWTDITPSGPFSGGDLVVSPSSPERLYVANGRLVRSDDGGSSWVVVGFLDGLHALQVDARLPETLYAAGFEAGVRRSEDGGATWVDASDGLPAERWVTLLTADPTQSGVLYAAVLDPSGPQDYFKSEDGGRTWSPLPLGLLDTPAVIGVDPNDPAQVFVGGGFRVMKSDDGGATWRQINRFGQAGHRPAQVSLGLVTDVAVSPSQPGTFYAAGRGVGAAVVRSTAP